MLLFLQGAPQNTRQIAAAATAKSLQSCPTLCDPMDYSLPRSSILGIFQARVLEWGAITFSDNKATEGQWSSDIVTVFLRWSPLRDKDISNKCPASRQFWDANTVPIPRRKQKRLRRSLVLHIGSDKFLQCGENRTYSHQIVQAGEGCNKAMSKVAKVKSGF